MFSSEELQELTDLIEQKAPIFEKANQGVKQALETAQTNNRWSKVNIDKMERLLPMLTTRSVSVLSLIDDL